MKYTIQIPMILTLEVEASDVDEAIYEAREVWGSSLIEVPQVYDLNERWEDCEIYDEQGNYLEETA